LLNLVFYVSVRILAILAAAKMDTVCRIARRVMGTGIVRIFFFKYI
jgi:hypothetical protein